MKIANPRITKLTTPQRGLKSEKWAGPSIFGERVERKAYELYEKRGRQHGRDFDDWLEAEKIVEKEMISGQ